MNVLPKRVASTAAFACALMFGGSSHAAKNPLRSANHPASRRRGLLRAVERHPSWDPWPSPEQVLPRFRISLKGEDLTLCSPKQDKAESPRHYLYFSVEAMFLLETS